MHKIWVILKREYLTRVRNRMFIIMTLLGPVLITLFYGAIFLVATRDAGDHEIQKILVKDESRFFAPKLDTFQQFHFVQTGLSEIEALKKISSGEFQGMLVISDRHFQHLDSIKWVSPKTLSFVQTERISNLLSGIVYKDRLKKIGLNQGQIDSLKPTTTLSSVEIDNAGNLKSSSSAVKSGVGFFLAIVVYMFIFIYGAMIMRSTLEEKTNRIVEVVISSVKPFQLMMGKILGVALVGLTQFTAWVILSLGMISVAGMAMGSKLATTATQVNTAMPAQKAALAQVSQNDNLLEAVTNLPFLQIIVVFLIFFVGGFLLYSSMFAAIGSAANQETDTQQFMMPISLPLVFGFVIAQSTVLQDPNGPMAKTFSLIPFTSPILMVVRSPFGLSWSEILLSATILIATFVFFVWMTGRIYRIGILMYGKKPSWKDLGKWIFRKS